MPPVGEDADEIRCDQHPDDDQTRVEIARRIHVGERKSPDEGMRQLPREELQRRPQRRGAQPEPLAGGGDHTQVHPALAHVAPAGDASGSMK